MGRNKSFEEREVPLKLGGVERVWHCLWVELDYVGLEVLSMQGNEGEEKGGQKELGFGFHGASRKIVVGF